VTELVVRAPASTANLGPGFDCAAAALDLWNELHVLEADGGPLVTVEGEGADEVPTDERNLALRAFAGFAPVDSYRFHFVNRIPLGRGLGSSAATIAAGLVAGASVVPGLMTAHDELLNEGLPLEGHADNLAAALNGGVCLVWRNGAGVRSERVATDLPFTPVAVAPDARVSTEESRGRLPESLSHADAAAASAQAALLGAAVASGDANLLAEAFHDLLHEPYRAEDAPLLHELRHHPVTGQAGVTLSGSGPSVVVWVEKDKATQAATELEARHPEALVLRLAIAPEGAH
jgi:homoserine kinase